MKEKQKEHKKEIKRTNLLNFKKAKKVQSNLIKLNQFARRPK